MGSESIKLFLPESFDLSFVFDLFHSSFLLGHLLDLVLSGKLFQHHLSELHFHSFLFLFLPDFPLSGLSLGVLHLQLLEFPFLGFFLLFSSSLGLELFSVKFDSQILELLSISSSFLFLLFEFLENFVFSNFLFLFGHLDCFFSWIKFFQVSHVLFLFLSC